MSYDGTKLAAIIHVTGISETFIGWYCCRPDTEKLEGGNVSKKWKETETRKEENILLSRTIFEDKNWLIRRLYSFYILNA
jgi:hypothetical protein